MIKGKSIQEVAVELNRQLGTKHDFIVPTSFLQMTELGLLANKKSDNKLEVSDYAHNQIAQHMGIPTAYYKRMRAEEPGLLSHNVNTWMAKQEPNTKRLIRVLDGKARAYLSDKYLPIDNWDVLNCLLPQINEAGCEIISAEVTESKLYVKALAPKIQGEIKKGDIVQAGLIIQNSEIGAGRVQISPLMYRLVCTNGLIVNDMAVRRNHVGRRVKDEDVEANGIYSRETIALDIAAFLSKAKDTVKAVLDQTVFNKIVDKARIAAGESIENVEECIEDVTSKYGLSEVERGGILASMIRGGDMSKWGLVNAVTATAHEVVENYDRSVELETIGGQILYSNWN